MPITSWPKPPVQKPEPKPDRIEVTGLSRWFWNPLKKGGRITTTPPGS